MRHLRLAVGLALALPSSAVGQDVFVDGLVPDWNQPNDIHAPFDNTRPFASHGFWIAWCVPTAAGGSTGTAGVVPPSIDRGIRCEVDDALPWAFSARFFGDLARSCSGG